MCWVADRTGRPSSAPRASRPAARDRQNRKRFAVGSEVTGRLERRGNQKRYFALKLPLAVDPKIVTFAYVDPGHQTDTELYSWGAAHGPLWDALRKKGRQVRVIGIAVENAILDRTDRVLETWAAADPGTSDEGLTPKQEINAIRAAMKRNDLVYLERYGGFGKAMKRAAALYKLPEANLTEG